MRSAFIEFMNALRILIVAAVTTHAPRLPTDVELQDWKLANLAKPSTVRMLIATVAESRIVHHVGQLTDRDWAAVQLQLANAMEISSSRFSQ